MLCIGRLEPFQSVDALASLLSCWPVFLLAGQLASKASCRLAFIAVSMKASCTAGTSAYHPASLLSCLPVTLLHILLANMPAIVVGSESMIIVVANSKGGVGKSTLAVHLAAWLHEQGHSVTLADCDTQHSSSEWAAEAIPDVKTVRLNDPDDILDRLPTLGQETDFVIADGPGSNTETSRALLLRADLALVPCKASMLEVRALAQATNVLRQAQDIRGGQPKAVIVLSMVGKTYRLTQDMKDAAAALELPLAATALTLKQIYADAPGQGAVVWQLGARGREAADEVDELFRELLPDACASKNGQQIINRASV